MSSYLMWGLDPLYWKLFHGIPASELIAHRIVWAFVFLLGIGLVQGRTKPLRAALSSRSMIAKSFLSGALMTINWMVYVWAVGTGQVIECSLGYFLVPLLNVALGRWLLGERLRLAQVLAVALAVIGVGSLIWQLGHPPWIALAVAGSFGVYGLLRKQSSLPPVVGITVETLLLAPFAAVFMWWRWRNGMGSLMPGNVSSTLLLLSTGAITAIPLILFAYGARGLRFITLGLLQYLAPTCQFLLGWLTYGEPLSREKAVAFALIWIGLLVYSGDAVITHRRARIAVSADVAMT